MTLDTENTIYICTDRTDDSVKLLVPKSLKCYVVQLDIGDPNPETNARAEYTLLAQEMTELSFDI
jgi:hypothetical protein